MLHNLEWLHGLDIQYDSSTFDTDPFEPQPDGVGTIFPFWVPSGNGKAEDMSRFHTRCRRISRCSSSCKHKYIDIWKRKLDWIASNGGMALMLIHPDYINLGEGRDGPEEYPLKYYSDFLAHVQKTYQGEYYHVLPKDFAKFWKENYLKTS